MTTLCRLALATALGGAVATASLQATTTLTWIGTTGDANENTNWSSVPVGNGTEDGIFGDTGTKAVFIPNPPVTAFGLRNITFNGSTGPTYTFSGSGAGGAPTLGLYGDIFVTTTGSNVTFNSTLNLYLSPVAHAISIVSGAQVTVNSVISGAVGFTKTGAGTLVLTGVNTYTDKTAINEGTVVINSLSPLSYGPSSLGASNGAYPLVEMGNSTSSATLKYTGGAIVSDRGIDLKGTTGGATIEAEGSGAVSLSQVAASGVGAKSLTLTGSSTYANAIRGSIVNSSSGATSVVKSGTGAWQLDGASVFNGGTTLVNGYLLLGASSTGSSGSVTSGPVGTGSIAVTYNAGNTTVLTAAASSVTLHNAISIDSSAKLRVGLQSSAPSSLSGLASNNLTLAGIISGAGQLYLQNSAGTTTLSGLNTYTGSTYLYAANVVAASATALGGQYDVYLGLGSTLTVDTPTLSMGSLSSGMSTTNVIALGANQLAIYQHNFGEYRGNITGTGSISKHGAGTLQIDDPSTYTGGTTIHSGKVILASTGTLGTTASPITLNSGAKLEIASGNTLSNTTVTLNSGSSLGGAGTIATPITVGSNVTLSPGSSPGTMTFNSDLTFASGGILAFEILDANTTLTAGTSSSWDLLSISGALAVTASSVSPFTIQIKSLTNTTTAGNAANFNDANSYSWMFASATSITTFDSNKFTIDRSAFSNSSAGQFFVSQSGNNLLLNFTPVPEPSTYVLMGTGLSLLAGAAWRRRRTEPSRTR